MKNDETTSEQSESNEAISTETELDTVTGEGSTEPESVQEDETSTTDEPLQDESDDYITDEPEQKPQKCSSVVPTLISLLALILVGGGLATGYYFWQQMNQEFVQMSSQIAAGEKRQSTLQNKLSEGQKQLEAQTQQIEVQRKSLTDYQAKLERDQRALKQRGDDVQTIYAAVEKQLGANTGHWRIAEAEHLMRIAQDNLSLANNIGAATTALKAADQRLRETNDPSWQRVREHLADEIGKLEAVSQADIAGLSATLDSLISSSDSLPLIGGHNAMEAPGKIDLDHGTAANVSNLLSSVWSGLKSMLVVRYNDRPVEAMLPPDRRFFIMQNLRLKLQSTKVALLQKNSVLYRSNLKQVISWVDGHFEKDGDGIKSFLSRLLTLDAANIAPTLPDISTSLRSLQERIDTISRRESAS
ncbi:MAG: uroporphyrinogen-III C-methyltransferase [Candidatus Polarisedimenticolaceae bacterium]|nr:uroporphyrinogen-III C-methyltransferase [Candidatus Polarisedimenticolaceae bacterium]